MNYRKELRQTLATLERNGVSMADWAEEAGINRSSLWRIVKGNQVPSIDTFVALQKSANKLLPKAA